MRYVLMSLALVALITQTQPVHADCKDRVRDMREDINDNKDEYSREARREAKKQLAAAELTFINPLECREHLRKARRALREGKQN